MSLDLITAEKLLGLAYAGIVGNAATEGVKLLWQKIRNRLFTNQPAIEREIFEIEKNPTLEKLKFFESFLQVEMHKDKSFAEEISKLGREITQVSSDKIEIKDFEAKDNAAVIGKAEGNQQFIGGTHNHEKK